MDIPKKKTVLLAMLVMVDVNNYVKEYCTICQKVNPSLIQFVPELNQYLSKTGIGIIFNFTNIICILILNT